MNINQFLKCKLNKQKITMVSCYDYTTAKIIEKSNIDCVLVGDTAAMLMHGYPDTTYATIDMMAQHTKAVSKGLKKKFLVADLPFMSYRKSTENTIDNVQKLIQSGAHAIKLEGAEGNLEIINHIVTSGVPVMGHIGLTPQYIHKLGGFKVQGKDKDSCSTLIHQAKSLEQAGCFAIVIECIPSKLAKKITNELRIPTIGIGAGPHTDGQVLVFYDLLGLQIEFKPKFLKYFLNGHELVSEALNKFSNEVTTKKFPNELKHSYE